MVKSMNISTYTNVGTEYNYSLGNPPKKLAAWSDYRKKTMAAGDHGHYGYPKFDTGKDVGGSFILQGAHFIHNPVNVGRIHRGGFDRWYYDGTLYANPAAVFSATPNTSAGSFGATAYARMKPTEPSFESLNAFYELKDLPGMLRQRLSNNGLKNIGNYYLALKFGWEPLLRDIISMVSLQRDAQAKLAQLLRDNGRPVRRRITLLNTQSEPSIVDGIDTNAFQPGFVSQYYAQDPRSVVKRYDTDEVWASARFRYWLPPGPRDIQWSKNMLARLYGLRPTPSVVYNAIPWSWLVDWFSNLGDVISNLDSGVADHLAADYCYVMRKTTHVVNKDSVGWFKTGWQSGSPIKQVSASVRQEYFSKSRSVGSPFGFGLKESDLSTTQLTILGALGLSRLP
jgi:hypothetical protein